MRFEWRFSEISFCRFVTLLSLARKKVTKERGPKGVPPLDSPAVAISVSKCNW